MSILANRLRSLRKLNKYTQKDIADFLGISESGYGYYEQDRNEPSLETLRKLAEKYNVSVSYLTGESDDQNSNDENSFSSEERKILDEIKKHPVLFHDLASDPEKKIKKLIKMWKFIEKDLEEDDEEEDIIED